MSLTHWIFTLHTQAVDAFKTTELVSWLSRRKHFSFLKPSIFLASKCISRYSFCGWNETTFNSISKHLKINIESIYNDLKEEPELNEIIEMT